MPTRQRDLARDIRTDRKGEVMAEPDGAAIKQYWLRPVGGGREWPVPREYVQIVQRAEAAT